jgi:uncharacterized membrane protein YgdD (TMEM256/DUF423 family)
MSVRNTLILASLLGALAVILGAFGAHSLKAIIDSKALDTYQLGVTYQYYHVLAMLAVGILAKVDGKQQPLQKWSALCFALGILLFSGSLYLIACRVPLGIEAYSFIYGPLTPIGGLFFIAGWILLLLSVFRLGRV